ncbi:hypothetical protein [Mucilaginibacter lappiensis]|uniref:Uncharacterized protein n=1 Tax=Mucilaginibacter lappiensis TaxID=354630 RepID=A0A841JJK4_9SPHI|nr:hypothetical protein [Mucilaginibacter lappiensis]MBB6131359.1 hypothetical protein [Mucilaginibacter lappiensis]
MMLQFEKLPTDFRPGLPYERLMQFAEAITVQRPNADLKQVRSLISAYLKFTQLSHDFHALKRKKRLIIKSKYVRQPLANISYKN